MGNVKYTGLLEIIPENLLTDEKVKNVAEALDKKLKIVSDECNFVLLLARLDELDEKTIDLLAWQLHVDFYDKKLPLANKRKLVKQSIDWHRRKGTKYAVEQVVSAAIGNSTIEEWFEYNGKPYTFRITNESNTVGKSISMEMLVKCINSVKNVRSHLESITLKRKLEMTAANRIRCGILPIQIGRKTIGIGFPDGHKHKFYTGVVHAITGHKTIGISKPEPVSIQNKYGIISVITGRKTIGGIR